ncbi:Sporulation domain protein [Magnetococcus marinus MC-1]|uniref:Sporulation domain protein n=1 Tax=Magnetococcus marinus (strain ATCC BAA-1437 / JCM 17883 / MC-1) TaxID=156889 RepID=A0LCX1_MAGMM|nr:SPOR domain-containing protein [Magnetococcus marinus]ABK45814.1 Sporulation domain protein [Magnetococcus marinus MC-1]
MGLFQFHHRWHYATGWIVSLGLLGMSGCSSPIHEYPIHYSTPSDQREALAEQKRAKPEQPVEEMLDPAPLVVPEQVEVQSAPPLRHPPVGEVVMPQGQAVNGTQERIPEPQIVEAVPPAPAIAPPAPAHAPVAPEYAAPTYAPVAPEYAAPASHEEGAEPSYEVPAVKRTMVHAKPKQVESAPPLAKGELYYVELGSYAHQLNADRLKRRVQQMGIPVESQPLALRGTQFTRVRAGPFPYRAEADWAARVLKEEGVDTKLVME